MVAPSKGCGTPRASAPLTIVSPCQDEPQGVPEYKLELAKFSDEELKELRTTFEELRIQPSQALLRELEQRSLNDCVTEKRHVQSPPSEVESREKAQPLSNNRKESTVHGRSSGNSSAPVPSNVQSELSAGLNDAEVENSSSTAAHPIRTSSPSPKQRTPAAAILGQQSLGASPMRPRGSYEWALVYGRFWVAAAACLLVVSSLTLLKAQYGTSSPPSFQAITTASHGLLLLGTGLYWLATGLAILQRRLIAIRLMWGWAIQAGLGVLGGGIIYIPISILFVLIANWFSTKREFLSERGDLLKPVADGVSGELIRLE
jgi:hypothetical protein